MKALITVISLIFCVSVNAQTTGVGVIAQMEPEYNFNETVVDSTSSVTITISNSVNSFQTIAFSGLSGPFSTSDDELNVLANGDGEITVFFSPQELGVFSDTLFFTGNVFGSGSIVFSGEGTLVSISVSSNSIELPTIPVGQQISSSFIISNTGTGSLTFVVVNNNNDIVSTVSDSILLAGEETTVFLTYTPQLSGEINLPIQIISNDPNNPFVSIVVIGSAVSQIEGNVCDLSFFPSNNPYTFTNNVTVPEGCQLEIFPGTIIDMNGYQLIVEGTLIGNGTVSDSIFFKNGNFIFRNEEVLNLQYWNVDFPVQNSFTLYENDFEQNSDYSDDELPCYGYNQNFDILTDFPSISLETSDDYGCDTYDLQTESPYNYDNNNNNKSLRLLEHNTYSNYDGVLLLKPIVATEDGNYRIMYNYNVKYNYRQSNSGDPSRMKSYYKINSEEWVLFNLGPMDLYYNEHCEFPISDLINLNESDTINVAIIWDKGYYRENALKYIDDLRIEKVSGNDFMVYSESFEDSSAYISGEWTYNNEQEQAHDIYLNADYSNSGSHSLKFTNENFNSNIFYINNISIPSDGHYYIEYYIKAIENKRSHRKLFYAENNGNGNYFYEYDIHNYSSYDNPSYDWEKRTARLSYYEAGDEIDLSFELYSDYTNNSSYAVEFYIDDIKIYNRSESSPSFIAQGNSITINHSKIDLKINQIGDNLGVSVTNSQLRSVETVGENSPITLYNSTILESTNAGLRTTRENSPITLTYSFVRDCAGVGIETVGDNSHIYLNSSMVSNNGSYGIKSNSQINANYSNVTFNQDIGLNLMGNSFSSIKNSIIWGNDIINYKQINTNAGVTSITYSSVQGLNAYGTIGGQYYFGDGSIDDDPVFTDQLNQHLSTFSNCVDAGTPWENDNHMPFGLGGVRADVGIYGGPDNWFWGGDPIPDGSPIVTAISDSPQDQGGQVGVLFNKSVWDNNELENKVVSYSIWRHFDSNGNTIDTISQGNWQLMGYMPAQAFEAYAYEAPTLGDSSIANGGFNSCFVVIAHTTDSSVYWYSDVACGYSTDDLSPQAPEVFAEQVDEGQVLISWNTPTEDDYSYSEVFSTSGLNTSNITDTLILDGTVSTGDYITYGVVHYDVNGNPSDTTYASVQIDDQKDYIPLYQGWNLISTRLTPNQNNIESIFSSLSPNNLLFVTGFNNGVSIYDPNGLPFLNTLNQFDDGYGYWVKVNQDDTLVIDGTPISHDFIPPYNAGWNLVGYVEGGSQSVVSYFDFLSDEDNLIFVSSFLQGVSFYDPYGLPFLNSLTSVDDNLGYWVKTVNPFGGVALRIPSDGQQYSPSYMLLNGSSNLSDFVGQKVSVFNESMQRVSELNIIDGGYLMTTAVYGDDPTTVEHEGLKDGETLHFEFNDEIIKNGATFNGDMRLQEIDLEFGNATSVSLYPNPTYGKVSIRLGETEGCNLDVEVYDLTGRLVYSEFGTVVNEGTFVHSMNFSDFESGVYHLKVMVNGILKINQPIIKQ